MGVKLPATGTGDSTPIIATEQIAGAQFELVKLVDGTVGGSQGAAVQPDGSLRVAVASWPALSATVTDFPANQQVSVASVTPGVLTGASVANFPTSQPVSVASVSPGLLTGASVPNFPTLTGASVSNWPATQPVSGYVGASVAGGLAGASISNLPAVQPISGYVGASVPNFPTLVGASVPNFPAVQPVSGYLGASVAGGYVGASVANPVSVVGSTTNFGGSVAAAPLAAATGGASAYHFISGASVNNVNVKTAAGTVYTVAAMNTNASPRFLRLYDKATVPSVGQDVPRQTYMLPGGAGVVIPQPVGMLFAAGIGFGVTGGSLGDTDTTVTALGDVAVNLGYL